MRKTTDYTDYTDLHSIKSVAKTYLNFKFKETISEFIPLFFE